MPESQLVIENLSFQYRTRPEKAIENISFSPNHGISDFWVPDFLSRWAAGG
jgi:hypothetical protein